MGARVCLLGQKQLLFYSPSLVHVFLWSFPAQLFIGVCPCGPQMSLGLLLGLSSPRETASSDYY